MRVTFKQLEAFIAVYDHGTFDGAARHLGVAQSAISKQIQELEQWFGFSLFDRSGRSGKPNAMAREVISQARHVLLQRGVFDSCLMSNEIVKRKLRIGVTELTALKWLPGIVQAIVKEFPHITILPVVDMGSALSAQLLAGRLDVVVLPDAFANEGIIKFSLHSENFGLYCSPGLELRGVDVGLEVFEKYALLSEVKKSGSGILINEWLRSKDVKLLSQVACSSLLAMIGLAISGLGVVFLPPLIADSYVKTGQLTKVALHPAPPDILYVAMARADSFTPILQRITDIVSKVCTSSSLV
ncbi:LysR family transcriptional regulator [Pseudomonas sp. PDM26]|uniref:LysR family transcriptional regulator n=1 Tax=Pseudomonas sp. PDM26 TaxID=2854766 RepID=UPI001C44F415|nr:LysR family transcriptional regulator [Pseudomonas sp. PDM26]MBV7547379.1 LysR family transcriptional regulator [Pseudomonas sp. PDM26]